jgi:hypothetical protein
MIKSRILEDQFNGFLGCIENMGNLHMEMTGRAF